MKPTISTLIKMKPTSEGGRFGPFTEGYCPHLVVAGKKEWLGVRAVHCPEFVYPNDERELDFELMYAPDLDYSDLAVGSRFTIHEGPKVIGAGVVIESRR